MGVVIHGGYATIEHPEDPGEGYPSIWKLPVMADFLDHCEEANASIEADRGLPVSASFDQCEFGAPTVKGATIAGRLPGLMVTLQDRRCSHPRGWHQPLLGKDVDGNFRTAASMEYPPRLCEVMAQSFAQALRRELPRPGHRVPVPPMAESLGKPEDWRLLFKSQWKFEEHQNVLEMRALVMLARHLARSSRSWDQRYLVFTDSLVCLGALGKGSSSSPALLRLCRKFAAVRICCGIRLLLRWVPTAWNVADGPSRGAALGEHPEDVVLDAFPRRDATPYRGQG